MTDIQSHFEFLIERWCERRALNPLRYLLSARASLNGLTDGWEDFRTNIRSIRARYSAELPEDELTAVIELIGIANKGLDRK